MEDNIQAPAGETSAWQDWLSTMDTPNGKQALMQFAIANLRGKRPGESSLSVFGDALGQSVGYLNKLKDKDAKALRQKKVDSDTDRSNLDKHNTTMDDLLGTKKTRENLDATTDGVKQRTKEDKALLGGKLAKQGADLTKTRADTNQVTDTTKNDNFKVGAEEDLLRAQAEALRAKTTGLAKAGALPAAKVQELNLYAETLMSIAAKRGEPMDSDVAMNQAFRELSVKNPELYNMDIYERSLNIKRGEAGAFLSSSPELQQNVIKAGRTITEQSFSPSVAPTKINAAGKTVTDFSKLQPQIPYMINGKEYNFSLQDLTRLTQASLMPENLAPTP